MKKRILLVFSLLSTLAVTAQEVVSTQGDSYSNASANIDFTIGEVVINTETDGTNDLTQGFHQTNWNFVGMEDHSPSYEATIFPNPTSEVLNIKTSTFENVTYTVYNAQRQACNAEHSFCGANPHSSKSVGSGQLFNYFE